MEKEKKEPTTSERLENSIRHQPDRYDVVRENGELKKVYDNDSGTLWFKLDGKWFWYE
jgi:hypothetical protein